MRVEVNTPDEFLAELEAEAEHVYEKIVRARIDFMWKQDEKLSRRVGLWMTALIRRDDGDYILECGHDLGSEDCRVKEKMLASAEGDAITNKLLALCRRLGLVLRHGKWEIY